MDDQVREYRNHSSGPNTLVNVFNRSIQSSGAKAGEDASWALTTSSVLIILLGRKLWPPDEVIKLLWRPIRAIDSLEQSDAATRVNLPGLKTLMGRSLLWALDDLLTHQNGKRVVASATKDHASTTKRALTAVRNGLEDSDLVALACVLFGSMNIDHPHITSSEWAFANGIKLVDEMFSHHRPSAQKKGWAILEQLVSSIGTRSDGSYAAWRLGNLFGPSLFSIEVTRPGDVAAPKVPIEAIRPLDEKEILRYWDELTNLWVKAIRHQIAQPLHNDLVRL